MIVIEGGGGPNATTKSAQTDTMLSPRFYTTDFKAMDRLNVDGVRSEWDADDRPNCEPTIIRQHFRRTRSVRLRSGRSAGRLALRNLLIFWSARLTAEFSGCVLYAEIKKQINNPDIRELFGYMSRDEFAACGLHQRGAEGNRCRHRS